MNEYQKLKEICNEIGYKNYTYEQGSFIEQERLGYRVLDVREIVFSPGFFIRYQSELIKHNYDFLENTFEEDFLNHLEGPVDYLYKLIIK